MFKYYFAYGSNIRRSQLLNNCPKANFECISKCINWRYFYNKYGLASIKKDVNSVVYGVVWQITEDCILKLDKYERLDINLYYKTQLDVISQNNGRYECVTYIASCQEPAEMKRSEYSLNIISSAVKLEFSSEYIHSNLLPDINLPEALD